MRVVSLIVSIILLQILISCENEPILPKEADVLVPPTMADSCSSDSAFYVNDIQPLLNMNCAFSTCHGGGSMPNGVELSNYNNVISTARVFAGNADTSLLYQVLVDTNFLNIMPPGNRLDSNKIALVKLWINQGALNSECKK